MNLQLSLKTKWFEMTKAGIKTEDYREINDYWCKRLVSMINEENGYFNELYPLSSYIIEDYERFIFKKFNINTMTLGYPKSTDTERILKLEHKGITIGYGNPEWGAEPNKLYFIIKHGIFIN